jgi:hypothetical protein
MEDPEPPCIGLDPDTYACPYCGARVDEECRNNRVKEASAPCSPKEPD